MNIELSVEERNMLIVLLIQEDEKFPDQLYTQMIRRLRRRLHDLTTLPAPST